MKEVEHWLDLRDNHRKMNARDLERNIVRLITINSLKGTPVEAMIASLNLLLPDWRFYADDVDASPYSDGTIVCKYDYMFWIIGKRKD